MIIKQLFEVWHSYLNSRHFLHLHITNHFNYMKITCFSLALFSALVIFSQCKNTKYTADNLPDEYLRFGNGGGFVGIETTYTLLENGQIFKSRSKEPDTLEITGCKRKLAKKILDVAETLGLETLDFMYPGNVYQFIEIQDDGKTNRIAWGDREHPVDEKISTFYAELQKLTVENK